MKEFFANMDGTQQFYWYIAIGASVIFIIQTIMTFVGADADTGVDADFDGNLDGGDSPFQLFSLRPLHRTFCLLHRLQTDARGNCCFQSVK